MKKVFTIALMAIALMFTTQSVSQEFSGIDKSPLDNANYPSSYKVSDKLVRVTYSRPNLKGRDAFELMTKDGPIWRTGANEAPEITFYQDVKFGGTNVKAGTYALLTMPGEKEWTFILHSSLNQWGAYFYKEGSDVARVKGAASMGAKSLEEFSIAFKEVDGGVHMVLGWDKLRAAVPIMMAEMKKM